MKFIIKAEMCHQVKSGRNVTNSNMPATASNSASFC